MKKLMIEKVSNSVLETFKIAEEFIQGIDNKNCIIVLSGDLGAGKTHFTKGIFNGVGYEGYLSITSPTFDLINSFHLPGLNIQHLDLYRLNSLSQEDKLWLEEVLNDQSLCIIEWGDKFNYQINKNIFWIEIIIVTENERKIKIYTN
jgi:tRNA threonylcarbamoyladenosine biosynthesis protein TsaE